MKKTFLLKNLSHFTIVVALLFLIPCICYAQPCTAPTLIITNPPTLCAPATVDITQPAVTAGSTVGLSYSYYFDIACLVPFTFPPTAIPVSSIFYIRGTLANGCYDTKQVIVVIDTINVWNGTGGTEWENPANWSCGTVPGPASNVGINSGTVIINSNVIIYTLTLNPNATLTVNPGFNLTVLH